MVIKSDQEAERVEFSAGVVEVVWYIVVVFTTSEGKFDPGIK